MMNDLTLLEVIENNASLHKLDNTMRLLKIYRENLCEESVDASRLRRLNLGLSACRLLMDLQVNASAKEADRAFATTLCRGLLSKHYVNSDELRALELDPYIIEVAQMIGRAKFVSKEEKDKFYQEIQKDMCALLVMLADRATLLEKLHELPVEESRVHVQETRLYFFSMCIFAVEFMPDLAPTISILRGKIKNLCEVYDILTDHHMAREQELSVEILRVREDNANLRARIEKLRSMC